MEPVHPIVKLLDEHLDATLERLEKGVAPVWDSQFQMGRTLITLASSALVLSVSAVQLLAGRITTPHWSWLLPVAWISFAVTVLTGASRQGWAGAARSFRLQLDQLRGQMRGDAASLSPDDPGLSEKFDAILLHAMEQANMEPQKAIKVHNVLNQVMFWTFTVGLAALLAFTWRNMPF